MFDLHLYMHAACLPGAKEVRRGRQVIGAGV